MHSMPVVFTSLWTQVFNIDKCPILFLFVRERNVNRKIDTPILLEEKNCSSAWKKQFKNVVFYLFCWNNCSKQFGRNIFILSTCPVLCRIKNCYIRPVIMLKNTVSNNVPTVYGHLQYMRMQPQKVIRRRIFTCNFMIARQVIT